MNALEKKVKKHRKEELKNKLNAIIKKSKPKKKKIEDIQILKITAKIKYNDIEDLSEIQKFVMDGIDKLDIPGYGVTKVIIIEYDNNLEKSKDNLC